MNARIFVLALALGGCDWKSDGLTRLEELYPTRVLTPIDAGATGPIDLGVPKCSGFAGTWAVRLVQNGTISPLGEAWKIAVTDLFLSDSDGQEFDLRFCDEGTTIVTSGGETNLGKAKVPDALKLVLGRSLIRIPVPPGATFNASDVIWTWGVKGLTDPLNEALPTRDDLTDARIWDQDDDGKVGVTLNVLAPMGDRYMARRAVWAFAPGRLTFDNLWVTGALSSAITENALGATNSLLLTPAPITAKPEGTRYELRCVGETYSCASLSKDAVQLFKDAPR